MPTKHQTPDGATRLRATDPAEASEAGRALGRISTPKKAEAARRNGLLANGAGGRPQKPLAEIPCTCAAAEALDGHRWNCPRGQAVKRRRKAGTL
jgi:hypothetical protein